MGYFSTAAKHQQTVFFSKPDKPMFSLFSKFIGRFYWEKCKTQRELVICGRKGVEYRI